MSQHQAPGFYHDYVNDARRLVITWALRIARGNVTRAAQELGLQRTYLLALIRQLGLRAVVESARRKVA